MYIIEHFIEYAQEKFKLEINPRSIEETNQIADDNQESENKIKLFEKKHTSEAEIIEIYDEPQEQMEKIAEFRKQERNRINEEIKRFEQMRVIYEAEIRQMYDDPFERMLKISELNQQEKKLRKQEQDLTFREMSQPISSIIKSQQKQIKKL